MIKINVHKNEHQPKNRHLFETIIPRQQRKINNAVHFQTNLILNDKIKKE
jgi:ribosomal protein S21